MVLKGSLKEMAEEDGVELDYATGELIGIQWIHPKFQKLASSTVICDSHIGAFSEYTVIDTREMQKAVMEDKRMTKRFWCYCAPNLIFMQKEQD